MHDEMTQPHNEKIQQTQGAPTPIAGGLLYLTVLVLMLLSSLLANRVNTDGDRYYFFMFLIQLVTIGLPTILYLVFRKKDIKYSFRLQKTSIAEILLSAGMAIFGYGVMIFVNLLWMLLLSRFGTPQPASIPPIETGKHYLMAMVVIALTPAVLEEFMFRGVIQRGYEQLGRAASIVLTGILFAFLHLSIVSIPAIIVMGILLCYIAGRANSIWVSMTYHFMNNAIAVTLAFLARMLTKILPTDIEDMSGSLTDIPPNELRMAIIAWAFIGFFALLLFGACFAGFYITTRGKQEELPAITKVEKGNLFKVILPVIFAITIIIVLLVFEIIEMVNPAQVMSIIGLYMN